MFVKRNGQELHYDKNHQGEEIGLEDARCSKDLFRTKRGLGKKLICHAREVG